ncbi:acyl carrier protein [Clostridium cochlearium]|jgi:acyl carrier protein|uniref:Acyl carrier protein n=2 Tax=Clostridium cochlearium TaxID=1494 RepID=A0A240B5A7_CLOCO|nr:acyl carrier protein [Clostridium cochlearium]MBE6065615.1 acyl carrier protein [Clostridium cochlearium]MBU5270232.1 acyl carrier protein [Clostridium cochlearium]MCR1972078.1 acyl carrier protein [Clostridium cochlearium]MDU1442873.1 acyl carrier protein [Clostridium cochlearium]NMA57143.1 acyl carrier protein [Clostridium cochlearium]
MIIDKVLEIIGEQLGIDVQELNTETSFEELGVDSLDLFQIVIEIEEEFDIQIEDAESIKTIGDAVKFVKERVEK